MATEPRQDGAGQFETLLYDVAEAVATITLNRPDSLNTIVPPMPDEVETAVEAAVADPEVRVIVVRGAGRAFCAGYDFGGGFHHWDEGLTTDGEWDPGKDFVGATAPSLAPTQKLMSVWRSPKPVIAQVHGWCVGGGSDFALCADLVIASEDARIGTPYSRMWGAYLSGMWIYRLGLAKAKEYALTGKPLSGVEAAEVELINRAVPFERLEREVRDTALGLARIPASQLAAMKLVVNHAYENMGLASTQTLGPILDGLMRNTPDAKRFIELAGREGVPAAVAGRDGPFGDYSQADPADKPEPEQRDRALAGLQLRQALRAGIVFAHHALEPLLDVSDIEIVGCEQHLLDVDPVLGPVEHRLEDGEMLGCHEGEGRVAEGQAPDLLGHLLVDGDVREEEVDRVLTPPEPALPVSQEGGGIEAPRRRCRAGPGRRRRPPNARERRTR